MYVYYITESLRYTLKHNIVNHLCSKKKKKLSIFLWLCCLSSFLSKNFFSIHRFYKFISPPPLLITIYWLLLSPLSRRVY